MNHTTARHSGQDGKQMNWKFWKKPEPPKRGKDYRDWNEDWKVGDIAECIVDGVNHKWHESCPPWERPAFGQQLTVSGFKEGYGTSGNRRYFLKFSDWPVNVCTTAFRKPRKVKAKKSEVVERILNAKPGKDVTRVPDTAA